jgi:hypothetical protein
MIMNSGLISKKYFFLMILVVLLPIIPLFPIGSVFSIDWYNHLWTIQYFGDYFSANHSFPVLFNANPVVGIPIPIFYAYHFYSIMGFFSSLIGSSNTFTVLFAVLFLVQFLNLFRTTRLYFNKEDYAFVLSTVVTWSIYPLSNIYHRAAVTEFAAVVLLQCCILSFLYLLKVRSLKKERKVDYIIPGLYFALSAVTHPLTAIYGGTLLFFIVLIIIFQKKETWLLKYSFINGIFIILAISPWIYALKKFAHEMAFVKGNRITVIPGIDSIWQRLSPTAIEWRSTINGIAEDVTFPYIDTQINLPLLILSACLLILFLKEKIRNISCRKIILSSSLLALALALTVISSFQGIADKFDFAFGNLQFAYRLISYINILVLLSILFFPEKITSEIYPKLKKFFLVALTVSLCGLTSKLNHIYAVKKDGSKMSFQEFMKKYRAPKEKEIDFWYPNHPHPSLVSMNLTPSYYGHPEYTIETGFSDKEYSNNTTPVKWIQFDVLPGKEFGHIKSQEFSLNEQSLVVSNIQPFPWNKISVNGVPVSSESIYSRKSLKGIKKIEEVKSTVGLSILLEKGSYKVEYSFEPDKIWLHLIDVSWLIILSWIALAVYALCSTFFLIRKSSAKF